MANEENPFASIVKTGHVPGQDWQLLMIVGFMLLFMGYLFACLYFGWLIFPFGIYFLYRAYRAKKGTDLWGCSDCGGEVKTPREAKCPHCEKTFGGK